MLKNIIYKSLEIIFPRLYKKRVFCGVTVSFPYRLRNYFSENYELMTMEFINQFEFNQDTILDIGAHVGLYTVIFAKKSKIASMVYAFEPSKSNYTFLNKTIDLNDAPNVVSYNIALSNNTGQQDFYVNKDIGFNANSLVKDSLSLNQKSTKTIIETISLDDFFENNKISRVQLIKIDVEGAEEQVLKGGILSLRKFQPVIILALHPNSISKNGDSLLSIWNIIVDLGYEVTYNNKIIKKNIFIFKSDLYDVILIPKSKNS